MQPARPATHGAERLRCNIGACRSAPFRVDAINVATCASDDVMSAFRSSTRGSSMASRESSRSVLRMHATNNSIDVEMQLAR
jgi:hypothetical protein